MVIEAANGKQGLDMIFEYYPDLVISDIMMPEMDGLELCKRIKNDDRISHIPVILLTAKAEEEDVVGGIEIGADEYITKPFNIKHLYAKADQLLISRQKLKEKFSREVFFEPSNIAFTNTDKRFIEKLIRFVEDNIESENFQVADIAQEIGMGKTNLYKKVQALTNHSVADFVRTIRLKTAAKLLLTTKYSVSEVAFKVGFKDASHFIKSFSKHYNLTPKRFIDSHLQIQD
jgi:YesN/AraC family two-component response regulator